MGQPGAGWLGGWWRSRSGDAVAAARHAEAELLRDLLDEPGSWEPLARLLAELDRRHPRARARLLVADAHPPEPLQPCASFCAELDCPLRAQPLLTATLCGACRTHGRTRQLWPLAQETTAVLVLDSDFARDCEPLREWLPLLASAAQGVARQRARLRLERHGQDTLLARELHDSVAQQLGFLAFQASRLQSQLARSQQAAPLLEELRTGLQGVQRQVRELICNARLTLGGRTLRQSLVDSVEEFGRRSTLVFELDNRLPDELLDEEQALQVLQIVREALANIVRHSHARTARLDLRLCGDAVEVSVQDDGIGLRPITEGGHFGLSIMRERALAIGASLSVERTQPRGTRVFLRLPGVVRHLEEETDAKRHTAADR